jgi:hypothetical protein
LKLASTVPTVDVKDENHDASRRGKLENGALDEDFVLSVATGTLDLARYEGFADKAHRVDDGFQAATRVSLEGKKRPTAKR